jgi:GntR family transcriptional regulator
MRTVHSERFLYQRVSGELRRRITARTYRPGSGLPSHEELAREFRVSAITIRRALHDLILEGLVISHQGLGVFVKDPKRIIRSLGPSVSTTRLEEEMERAGVKPGIRELSLTIVPASEDIAGRLQLKPGTEVYRHDKLILADEEPISEDVIYIPRQLGDTLISKMATQFAFSLLFERGIRFDHIDFSITGDTISQEQAGLFGLVIGFPLIVFHYTPIRDDGTPVLAGTVIWRADRLSLNLCARPEIHRQGEALPKGRSAYRKSRVAPMEDNQ